MTAVVFGRPRLTRASHVLKSVTYVLAPLARGRRTGYDVGNSQGPSPVGSPCDLRVVDASCGPVDEDVWDRVVALRRDTDHERAADGWREWARALRTGVDDGRVRLLLAMDGPRLLWFAAVATDSAVALPPPHVRVRPRSHADVPC